MGEIQIIPDIGGGMMKRFCCYWEGAKPPAYIAWCISSWTKYVNLDDILFLNQSNVTRYLGDVIDMHSFRRYGFAKQSDIVSAAYLFRYGGVFLDSDTVLVNKSSTHFIDVQPTEDCFSYFGYSSTNAPHIAVLSSPPGGTIVTKWVEQLFERVPCYENDTGWAYVGNEILDPLVKNIELAQYSRCYDVNDYLATPETRFAKNRGAERREKYIEFWFKESVDESALNEICANSGGIVMLHNSWTPRHISELPSSELVNGHFNLAALLRRVGDRGLIDGIQERIYYGS
ncbi:capsular polysaccharide synthesis protein [Actinomycetaceae bacterium MB13-C1-2]|nr:capsular polysaccharide synthesis protein [Actinomycetaceae bacterium MB13-C1-2]